jgi:hypothetical protein
MTKVPFSRFESRVSRKVRKIAELPLIVLIANAEFFSFRSQYRFD